MLFLSWENLLTDILEMLGFYAIWKKKKNTMLYFTYIGKSIHIEGFCRYISTHIHVCRCFRVQLVYKVYCECLSVYSFYCVQHFSYWFTILKVYLQLSTYLLGDQSHSHFYLAYKVLGWWYEWYISCHANLASKNTVQKNPNFRRFHFWRLEHEYYPVIIQNDRNRNETWFSRMKN